MKKGYKSQTSAKWHWMQKHLTNTKMTLQMLNLTRKQSMFANAKLYCDYSIASRILNSTANGKSHCKYQNVLQRSACKWAFDDNNTLFHSNFEKRLYGRLMMVVQYQQTSSFNPNLFVSSKNDFFRQILIFMGSTKGSFTRPIWKGSFALRFRSLFILPFFLNCVWLIEIRLECRCLQKYFHIWK